VAGRRAGFRGERSSLWFEFARVVQLLRPRWVCVENVPGLFSSNHGADFGQILVDLDGLGYGVAWRVLDARWFGVPQRRRRVFLVGCLGDAARAQAVLAVGDGADNLVLADPISTREGKTYTHESRNNFRTHNVVADVSDFGVRRLTPLECERLQGWPDDHTRWTVDGKEIPDSHRYRCIGNGVVAPVAEWIGHRLVEVDSWR